MVFNVLFVFGRRFVLNRLHPLHRKRRRFSYNDLELRTTRLELPQQNAENTLTPALSTPREHLIRPAATFSPSDAEKGNPMGEGVSLEACAFFRGLLEMGARARLWP
jgi:hypothetical protein